MGKDGSDASAACNAENCKAFLSETEGRGVVVVIGGAVVVVSPRDCHAKACLRDDGNPRCLRIITRLSRLDSVRWVCAGTGTVLRKISSSGCDRDGGSQSSPPNGQTLGGASNPSWTQACVDAG